MKKNNPKKILVIVSGYFNPLHSGHIKYFKRAKALGDELLVIVNNDEQVKLKGSKEFLDEKERLEIIKNIKPVDYTFLSKSKDKSVSSDFLIIKKRFKNQQLIFAKGADRNKDNLPESEIKTCKKLKITIIFDVGGTHKSHKTKTKSSSKIIEKLLKKERRPLSKKK
ncbi:MAG: adenylyltransferase/cytidyltransferase family protein [Candidatus Nanoarchaeia archaeon]